MATETTSIVAQVNANPVMVLTDPQAYSGFYQSMAAEVDAHVPDITTATGRKEIASLAYKVTRTKTAIDAAGKTLNEEARQRINTVDAQRRKIREELEGLAEKARKPLTDWEAAEAARIANAQAALAHIEGVGRGYIGPDPQPYGLLFSELDQITVDEATFGDLLPEAQKALATAREKLEAAQARDQQAAAERDELERLRAEAAERERVAAEEANARAVKEAEEQAARDAAALKQQADEQAARKAQADRERIQQEEQAKAAAAIKAAEDAAAAALREAERIQRESDERAAAAEAETKRKAAAEAAEIQRQATEKAAREADREHRAKLMGEAKVALVGLGVDEETARKVVLAIIAGEIPHAKFQF